MALVRPNFASNLRLDLPKTTYNCKTPLVQPSDLPARAAISSYSFNQEVKTSSELEKIQVLGHGNGGTVYKVQHKKTGAIYALKVFHSGSDITMQSKEFEIFSQTNNPHVVGFCGAFEKANGDKEILMEYMDAGSLESYIKTHGALSEGLIVKFARHVLQGFEYLHSKKIVHRDIKPSNFLINQKMEVKIADFGVSKIVRHALGHCSSFLGTCAYMSPERFDPDTHGPSYDGFAADVWSLGLTFMELYIGHYPFLEPGQKPDWPTLMCAICFGDPPTLPEEASENFKHFIGCCLQKEPNRRWTIPQLLQHPFIKLET